MTVSGSTIAPTNKLSSPNRIVGLKKRGKISNRAQERMEAKTKAAQLVTGHSALDRARRGAA